MSESWIDAVLRSVTTAPIVRAVVIEAKGSTPREVGAWMLIRRDHSYGTIGGGALEHTCIARAREMLTEAEPVVWQRAIERFHLGPELNQCCGGAVTILLERFGIEEANALAAVGVPVAAVSAVHPLVSGVPVVFSATSAPARGGTFVEHLGVGHTVLWLYGAGHVGAALIKALEGLPFSVRWHDADRARSVPDQRIVVGDLANLARHAPVGTFHVVMTHSHALDEAIVAAILRAGTFGYLGLIGSDTKGARFRQRLLRDGHEPAGVARMHCPIGLPGLAGKAPAVIAASVAADLLLRRQMQIDPAPAVQ